MLEDPLDDLAAAVDEVDDPGGRPSASSSSNASCWVIGTCSEGLRTKAFPHAIANGRNQNGTIAGKLNGTIAAHTPTGWRIVSASMLRDTSSRIRPCIVVGIAHAASTISIIRATSARASTSVLPISVVTAACELLVARDQALAEVEQLARPGDRRHRAPLRQRLARRARPPRRGRQRPTAAPAPASPRSPGW